MLKEKVEEALNDQIQAELYSAYMYLAMAAYFEHINLPGHAHWMKLQSQEETEHAMRIYSFVSETGGRVTLKAIEKPPADFDSPLDVFEKTYQHEQKVTRLINELYQLAIEEKDYATQVMLQWFIDEQVEEEASAEEILEKLRMIEDKKHALLMLDRELGQRE